MARAGKAGETKPAPRELEPPVHFERPYLLASGYPAPIVRHRYIFDFAAGEIRRLIRFLYCLTPETPYLSLDEVRGLRLREAGNGNGGTSKSLEYTLEIFDAKYRPHIVGQASLERLFPLLEGAHAIARILRCPLVAPMKYPIASLIPRPVKAWAESALDLAESLNPRQRLIHDEIDAPIALDVRPPRGVEKDRFKIVAFNIYQGRRILKILGALQNHADLADADVLALQEVDRHNERTGGVDICSLLAREVGMNGVYGVEFIELNRGRRTGGGGDHGNLTLAHYPIHAPQIIPLPMAFDWRKSKAMPRLGRRMAIATDVMLGGTRIRVINAHLENQCLAKQRFHQIQTILEWERQLNDPVPAVLLGDMNTFLFREPSKFRQIATAYGYEDALPRRPNGTWGRFFRLDWILTRNLEVMSSGICRDVNGSDHKPVWAVIKAP